MTPDAARLTNLLMPYAMRKQVYIKRRNARFVHYTSAEVAISILTNSTVWMRNAVTMNDFLEVEHGKRCLFSAYKSPAGIKLREILNGTEAGLDKRLEELFNAWLEELETQTFLTCFSEHRDCEDTLGRLSMWRAYGGSNGVALVFNNSPFLAPTDALKAYSSPVAYLDVEAFEQSFSQIVEGLVSEWEFLQRFGAEGIIRSLFVTFRFAVLCTKHPGFREEREWRVLYSPAYESSKHIKHDVEIVRGVPQQVYKIPLKNIPDEGFVGAELPDLLDRIIIGPTDNQLPMLHAFRSILKEMGVNDPDSKVAVSAIPLRQR
jgi:hypothetical protein